ncbi:unnamed protein product [Rhizophagus irregularis]|nr:unnamed protein product [Rhizophagus irregularis]
MPTPSIPNTDQNQKKAIKTFYDVNSVFEDPILIVESHDKIINQFLLLSILLSIIPDIQSITDSEIAGKFVLIPCKCFNSEITMRILTRLEFNEQRKIVKHEDVWSLKDLIESLPIVGFLYAEVARKFNAMAHALEEWNI